MYKKILVPIDGSPASNLGLEEAIKLADDQKAALRILHVLNEWLMISPDSAGFNPGDVQQELRASGDTLLSEADARARAAGVNATSVLLEQMGSPIGGAIIRHAEEWPADLIVCGTHGRRGMRRLVLGSDAEYIIRHSRVPILLRRYVPEDEKTPA